MRLTAKSEYGLLAMMDLACRGGVSPVSAREISERQVIPAKFLEQLFAGLRKAGLVTAVRGARGGFILVRDPSQITVLHVVEALEGPLKTTVCGGDRGASCGKNEACAAAAVWERATEAVRSVFENTTLAELASAQERLDAPRAARDTKNSGGS
ncbi:MAG: Rrf2 family transcriptional regulator [Clostridiales bacterium]|nr:Rrf2 family transcriptional regulator [Clostridiales bacterium]